MSDAADRERRRQRIAEGWDTAVRPLLPAHRTLWVMASQPGQPLRFGFTDPGEGVWKGRYRTWFGAMITPTEYLRDPSGRVVRVIMSQPWIMEIDGWTHSPVASST